MTAIIIIVIILVVLFALWKFFEPSVEVAPISYDDTKWLIIWYNQPCIENRRIVKCRTWHPLIQVNK